MSKQKRYVPALGFDWLTPFYDPVVRLTTRESTFKNALVGQADFRPGDSVLDLACGSGTLAILLAQTSRNSNVTGLDADSKILGIARKKAHGADQKICFVRGMSFQLPFADESFHHIFSSLFFHHINREEKINTLKELRRVLKPRGSFHVADFGTPGNTLMKLCSYMIMVLDGFDRTRESFEGNLPELIMSAGFGDVKERNALNTVFGTIRMLEATVNQDLDS